MANTAYGVNHPLAVKAWSRKLFNESIKKTWFSKFIGTSSNSLIQRLDDLNKGPGDRIRVGLRMLLTGDGVQGDATLEGNEESLTTYSCDVLINQIRHAVRSDGRVSEQRVPFNVREEMMTGLSDWWAEKLEKAFANQLVGNTTETNTLNTGNNSTAAPSSNNWILANSETAEASISNGANWTFTLTMIDRCVARARTQTPRIRPLRIEGDEYYAMFLHPWQVYQLRTSTSTGQCLDIQKAAFAAMSGAASNPIFTGALGIYNGVVLHEAPYLPVFTSTGSGAIIRRAVFCGAQSAIMATGRETPASGERMSWVEEKFDYGNKLGVSAGMIFGVTKSVFNSTDFATITVSTGSPVV